MKRKIVLLDQKLLILFFISCIIFAFFYGMIVYKLEIFPYGFLKQAELGFQKIKDTMNHKLPWYYHDVKQNNKVNVYHKNAIFSGNTLITSIAANNEIAAEVIDVNGEVVHQWAIDWFQLWPNATHLTADEKPKEKPGATIHGIQMLAEGDIVFNFEHLGLMRLNACSQVVWRLSYRTHHSIFQDENGYLWVSGQINHEQPVSNYPAYSQPFIEPMILKVSTQGEILQKLSIMELLQNNGLNGLLMMSTKNNRKPYDIGGDTLHLNDIEVFPSSKQEGFFKAGDILVSLRNINGILVFDGQSYQVKYKRIGNYVRQHDPDFIDGNTISVFDNNNFAPESFKPRSMIRIESLNPESSKIFYAGTDQAYFYTDIMGKHQWLPNGNLLITSSTQGRAFEIDPQGKLVWEYFNIIADGLAGIITEATRLPVKYDKAFFEQKKQQCHKFK